MSQFVPLAERVVDAILERDPTLAMYAGDHRYDDRLPDLSAGAVASDVAMLGDAANALAGVDEDALDPEQRVDHAILASMVDRALFERMEIREHEWSPLAHNPGPLLHALLVRPFAPASVRLAALADRLAAVPDALATARATLRDCPRIQLETAVGQFAGAAALVRDEVPRLLEREPGLGGRVLPAATAAAGALEEFATWLADRIVEGEATGDNGRDPRLGRRLFEARLWHTLDTEMPAGEIVRRAWAELDRAGAELRELAGDEGVRSALDRLAADHPDDSSIVELAVATMAETTEFVRQHDLVSLLDDPCVIEEMPEFARGVAVAYCDAPGPLETADVPTFYCIAPTPAGWPAERVESFYREYNSHMIRNLTVHEAMPGHFLQLAHARRFRGATRVRAVGHSGPFVEGWAVYAEELMIRHGFGGPAVRAQQLKTRLRMCLNAILDQAVHSDGIAEADAMAMLMERGFQEEGEAAGKWRRALLTSTQLSTYFVGFAEVAEVAAARPAGVGQRAWHDAMLAHGSPPPRHLRTLLGLSG